MEELRKRLVLRSTETEDEINKRLSRFEEEDNLKKEFDYNLINDNFETTFEKIKEIINRHKKRIKMAVDPISFSKLLKKTDDIYEAVVVSSKEQTNSSR